MARKTVFRSCNICEAMCGLAVEVDGGRVISIKGDPEDPFSRGFLCPKARALADILYDPDRLRRPVRRTRGGWEQLDWEDALDLAAGNISHLQKGHGKDSIGVYIGNPTTHCHGTLLFILPLLQALGTKNRFSYSSVDQFPLMLACYLLFGHQLLFPVPDVDRTDFFLVLGANPAVSGGSIMTAPGMARRIIRMRRRGARVVVVDPRRTLTARLAGEHLFIRPGTDSLLLLSMLQAIFSRGLSRPRRLASFTDGLDRLAELAAGFPPEKVAGATGIEAKAIERLAVEFAHAGKAVAYGRLGTCVQEFGSLASWLTICLNLVTGNLDRPGGSMFGLPAFDLAPLMALSGEKGSMGRWKSAARGLPEFGGELPAASLAEQIEHTGSGGVRGLITLAGNPVLSAPNGNRVERALGRLSFMASMDWYINETTRHAHLILPPTAFLEHDHYDIVGHAFGVRQGAKYSRAVVARPEYARHNWEILQGLIARLDNNPARRALMSRLPVEAVLGAAIRFGPRGAGINPLSRGLTLARIERHPHGLDLGPLTSMFPGRLYTRGKRIHAVPELLAREVELLKERFFGAGAAPLEDALLLIGRRHLRSNNSWLHSSPRMSAGKDRCTAMVHPDDAKVRGLADGDLVIVRSAVGGVTLPAQVSDEVMPGVISIPHGFSHGLDRARPSVIFTRAGASVNDITDDRLVDSLTGNAAFSGVPVTLEKAYSGASGDAISFSEQPQKNRC